MRKRLVAVLDALGPAGVLSIGVFLYCAGLWFFELAPAERDLQIKQQLTAQRSLKAQPLQRITDIPQLDGTARFYELFPTAGSLTDELQRLHRLAAAAGLQIVKGDYLLEEHEDSLGVFHASLPVRGSYSEIRGFIGIVLKEIPIASIDGLRFERKRVGEPQLEAHIRVTLYFRPATAQEH